MLDHSYYKKALKNFNKFPIIALTDDNKNFKKIRKQISSTRKMIELKKINTLDTFRIIMNSNGGICSNSTFSWWEVF